jgi:hypothetical protein
VFWLFEELWCDVLHADKKARAIRILIDNPNQGMFLNLCHYGTFDPLHDFFTKCDASSGILALFIAPIKPY